MHQRNRAANILQWTDEEYWLILLRQFKRLLADRLLAEQGQELSDGELKALAQRMAVHRLREEPESDIRAALIALIEDSLSVLRNLDLDYAQSLRTTMNDLSGWQTTADFIALANEKANAELRISVGAALLAGLGDVRYGNALLQTYLHGKDDPEDVDAIIARRALNFAAQIPLSQADWSSQIENWLQSRSSA